MDVSEYELPEDPPGILLLQLGFMRKFQVLPVDDSGELLVVLMADPADFNTREVLTAAYGKALKILKAEPELISQLIYRWYEANADMADENEPDSLELGGDDSLVDDPDQLRDMASEAPVIRLVNHLITRAIEMGASDIHIEPRKAQLWVRYRIDGVLHDQEMISPRLKAAITSRVKLMSKMDIAERRLPQDGRIKVKIGRYEIDMRVSTVPVHHGESIVLRLLHQEGVQLELSSLGFSEEMASRFHKLISAPYGIFLVTGPTGSGKTTTLYSALNEINKPDIKILTVEDPVEYQLEGVNQVQVKSGIGLTYAATLRAFLRHDPDVVLIGEIRDRETAEIAVQAALTGHMVFSTLHTNDAAGAVTRLEDMGVERYLISSSLVGVMAQRLVRKICPHCFCEEPMPARNMQALKESFHIREDEFDGMARYGAGCNECGKTGYRGRVGIFELMEMEESLQSMVAKGEESGTLRRQAMENGMETLRRNGFHKAVKGVTTFEEILRVTR